jgi:ParB family chromosome partitioning protein
LPRLDFRSAAATRLAEERDLSPRVISLLSPEGSERPTGVRFVPLDRIAANPDQPRMVFEPHALAELAASIREHGVLQPVLVRPTHLQQHYQLVAGERRWRAAREAGLTEIPALIEQLDDDTALEIGLIENLQREDLSPLEEATIYQRMIGEHGYSIRRLAQKLGKDKGYVENRLRLASAPPEIKQLVSVRKDTVSHAYELLKVEDARKRRRLAEQVANGELSLVKLREKIDGPARRPTADEQPRERSTRRPTPPAPVPAANGNGVALGDDALIEAKQHLSEAIDRLAAVLGSREVLSEISEVDRSNLAKYLAIARIRLENVIVALRTPGPGGAA